MRVSPSRLASSAVSARWRRRVDSGGWLGRLRCLPHLRLQRHQLFHRFSVALARGQGQRVAAMPVLRRRLPGVRLARAARHVLGAIEEGRAQLPIGPAGQVHHVLGGAAGIAVDEQAPLLAAAALADLGVALEPVRGDGKADREVVAVAQAHADRAIRRAVLGRWSSSSSHQLRSRPRSKGERQLPRDELPNGMPPRVARRRRTSGPAAAASRLRATTVWLTGRRDARQRRLLRQVSGGWMAGRRPAPGWPLVHQRHGEAVDAASDERAGNGDAQHVGAGNSGKTRPRERSNPTRRHERRYSDTNCTASETPRARLGSSLWQKHGAVKREPVDGPRFH